MYGDVHDIGKSLVNTILSNNGYTVFDLGKQVPVNTIIEKAQEVGADAIGLSALLVSTSKQMPLCVQELDKRGIQIPVLIGGAAINRRFGRRAMFVEGERPYDSGVFYCKDAFEGAVDDGRLQDPDRRDAFVAKNLDDAKTDKFLGSNTGKDVAVGTASTQRSDVSADHAVPTPPFWGTRVLDAIPLKEVFELLDLDELYRLQWGGRGSGPEYERIVREEFEPVRHRLEADAIANGWLKPQAVYGYFPAQSQGNDVIIYDPAKYVLNGETVEISRFKFPRMDGRERLCIADYFRSVESGEVDVASLPGRDRGNGARRKVLATPDGERIHRGVLHARHRRRDRRSGRRVDASSHPRRAAYSAGPRKALLVGVRRLPRSRGSRRSVQAAARRIGARHGADERVPADARAEHRRVHRPPSAGEVLRRARRGREGRRMTRTNADGGAAARARIEARAALLRDLLDPSRIVLFDGAMGTMLYGKGVFINQCYDELSLRAPELVRDVHKAYVKAGAEVLETNSFGANRLRLAQYGPGQAGPRDQHRRRSRRARSGRRQGARRRRRRSARRAPRAVRPDEPR